MKCEKCQKDFKEDELMNGLCFDCFEKLQQEKQFSKEMTHFIDNKDDNVKVKEKNLVASILKVLAIVAIIASIIVLFIPNDLGNYYSFLVTIAGIISSIFIYALGEIIQLLEDIKNK